MNRIIFTLLIACLVLSKSLLAVEVLNDREWQQALALSEKLQKSAHYLSNLKIAILDNGFHGHSPEKKDLPASTEMISSYSGGGFVSGNPLEWTPHGLRMAQIVWAVIGKPYYQSLAPKFYLLNANGLTNLRNSVKFAIDKKVDIILYSQNWEYGGNFDGRGFINAIVNEASSRGILWINAAGNYGSSVYNGKVEERILRFENLLDENSLAITLSWNDFQESEDYQTNKDLDFELLDESGKVIDIANRAQVKKNADDSRKSTSHARERLTVTLSRGHYSIHIKKMAGAFAHTDRMRLTLLGQKSDNSINFINHTSDDEIMIPGDNKSVLTIGSKESFSARGKNNKPEITIAHSEIIFSDGTQNRGTSNAAAIVAGVALLIKGELASESKERTFSKNSVINFFNSNAASPSLPAPILRALTEAGEILLSDIRIENDPQTNRPVIILKDTPCKLLPYFFKNSFAHARATGTPLEMYRFYIAASNGPRSFLGVETFFSRQDIPTPLPSGYNWIELRK
ncbi:MAG: S8 family serine peptidase [Oligoflexia bacterium]|nr:S8 family serine peptidase [Oligoflexia bacterium]MBF0366674.1 S8 family serine peptidase [Oligoflexia bacterium]